MTTLCRKLLLITLMFALLIGLSACGEPNNGYMAALEETAPAVPSPPPRSEITLPFSTAGEFDTVNLSANRRDLSVIFEEVESDEVGVTVRMSVVDEDGTELQSENLYIHHFAHDGSVIYTGVAAMASRHRFAFFGGGTVQYFSYIAERGDYQTYVVWAWAREQQRFVRTNSHTIRNFEFVDLPPPRHLLGDAFSAHSEDGIRFYRFYNERLDGDRAWFEPRRELAILEDEVLIRNPPPGFNSIELHGNTIHFRESVIDFDNDRQLRPVDHGQPTTDDERRAMRLSLLSHDSAWVELLTGQCGSGEVESETERAIVLRPDLHIQPHLLREGGEIIYLHYQDVVTFTERYRRYTYGGESLTRSWANHETFITVKDTEGNTLQEFSFESSPPHDSQFVRLDNFRWHLAGFQRVAVDEPRPGIDINFDGYYDITALYGVFGARGFMFQLGWVWNPQTRQFDETNFHTIPDAQLIPARQVVRGGFRSGSGTEEFAFRFIDGDFVLTNRLERMHRTPWHPDTGELMNNYYRWEDGRPIALWEEELVNGEMVAAWPIITDTDEGRAIMHEHLFGEDSIWFPRSE